MVMALAMTWRGGRAAGPGAKVVTLMVDSGLKYLGTDVFARG